MTTCIFVPAVSAADSDQQSLVVRLMLLGQEWVPEWVPQRAQMLQRLALEVEQALPMLTVDIMEERLEVKVPVLELVKDRLDKVVMPLVLAQVLVQVQHHLKGALVHQTIQASAQVLLPFMQVYASTLTVASMQPS